MKVQCVICSDFLAPSDDICATPCGHIFHHICLLQWIERSKSCPQCRQKTTEKNLTKLFLDEGCKELETEDVETLQNKNENLKFQLRLKETQKKKLEEECVTLHTQTKGLRNECKTLEGCIKQKDTTISALKSQLQYLKKQEEEAQQARQTARNLQKRLDGVLSVEVILQGTTADVEDILTTKRDHSEETRALATWCSMLKRELSSAKEAKVAMKEEASYHRHQFSELKKQVQVVTKDLENNKERVRLLEEDLLHTEEEKKRLEKRVSSLQRAIVSPSADVKNSALNRLLQEHPTPEVLKKQRLTSTESGATEDENTTEVVGRRLKTSETEGETAASPYWNIQSGNVGFSLCRTPVADSSGKLLKTMSGFNLFKRPHSGLSAVSSSKQLGNLEEGYNGFGGHSSVEKFPVSKLKPFKKKSRKMKVTVRTAGQIQTLKMDDFINFT